MTVPAPSIPPDEELELSIVMPCLNEAETLETCIRKARTSLDSNGIRGEIVIADNGSTDGSQQIAERLGARVAAVGERGYGAALAGGIEAARGRYVIMADADDSYDFSNLMPFVTKLREGWQLVMGNRFRGGIAPGAMPPLHRYLGNPVLTGIGRLLFRSVSRDFHCGLRGFRRDAILTLGLRTTGMEFASEMVVKATLQGLRVCEVPTTLAPDGRSRPPHLRSWRDGWRHLRFLLLFSPRWLFLYPGVSLMAFGLAVGAWILPGPRRLGDSVLDVHTLLYAASALTLGFQSVMFAVFTKVFAIHAGLLPRDQRLARFRILASLEAGLIGGGVLIVGGIAASVWAVLQWRSSSYGPLDPSTTLRLVIPATLALVLGAQVILYSFFLSVLDLPTKGRMNP